MRGLGTLINVGLILLGGCCGHLFGRKIGARMRQTLMTACGVAVIMLGVGGVMEKMLSLEDGALHAQGTIMMIVSLALGGFIGEWVDIDRRVERCGEWLREKSGSGGDAGFVHAFVTASCTVCIGAMAVVGAIEDGIRGDFSVLLAKGVIDAVIICVMTASMGRGCVFSALPVALFQGAITLVAALAGSFMPQSALDNLSYVGSALIFCVGLNLIREEKIRVANLLPAVVVAALMGALGF